VFTIGNMLV
jgi:ATP-binding cassette subfamily C (CFTR/MRP) protein 1